jgi:hypothetical protein
VIFALLLWSLASGLGVRANAAPLNWFGAPVPAADFLLASLVFFASWAVIGAWRLMREELQVQAPPLAWVAFAASFMVFCAGFWQASAHPPAPVGAEEAAPATMRLLVAYGAGLALLYLAAIFEAKDPVVFRRLLVRWRTGGARAALAVLPCWLATVPLLLGVGALVAAAAALSGVRPVGPLGSPVLVVVSSLAFATRDLALLLTFNFSRNPKRADVATFFYWVLLYGVVPTIVRRLDSSDTLYLFYPTGAGAGAVLGPAVQAAAMLLLLRLRWRRAVAGPPG